MGSTITLSMMSYRELKSIQRAYSDLHDKLSSTVTNEVYNDDLNVNEHEFDVEQLKEIALDHYHGEESFRRNENNEIHKRRPS